MVEPEVYAHTVRYIALRALDTATGQAHLMVPNGHLREQVRQPAVTPAIRAALSRLCGKPMDFTIVASSLNAVQH